MGRSVPAEYLSQSHRRPLAPSVSTRRQLLLTVITARQACTAKRAFYGDGILLPTPPKWLAVYIMSAASFGFNVDDVVLAEWGEKLFYAKITAINSTERRCKLMFDDGSQEEVNFTQVHNG